MDLQISTQFPNIFLNFFCFVRGVMTLSFMPTGPDALHVGSGGLLRISIVSSARLFVFQRFQSDTVHCPKKMNAKCNSFDANATEFVPRPANDGVESWCPIRIRCRAWAWATFHQTVFEERGNDVFCPAWQELSDAKVVRNGASIARRSECLNLTFIHLFLLVYGCTLAFSQM